jgi:hypothetical protein
MEKFEQTTGFTFNTCGKIFQTEEEFNNRHKTKKIKNDNGPIIIPSGNGKL